ncbi:hypothetical protein BCV72DRAFT_322846, partial [Rhizopus microsporus var. microsporus]
MNSKKGVQGLKNRSPSTRTTTGTSNIKSTKNLFLKLRSGRLTPIKLSPLSISTQRTLEHKQEQRQKYTNNSFVYKKKFNLRIPKTKKFSREPLIKLQGLHPSVLDMLSSKIMMLEIMSRKPLDYRPVCNTRESPLNRIEQTTLLTKNLWQIFNKPNSNSVCSKNNINNNQQHGHPYGREGLRVSNRGYTSLNARPFGGNFHQRGNSRGNRFTSSTSSTDTLTDNNQQQ